MQKLSAVAIAAVMTGIAGTGAPTRAKGQGSDPPPHLCSLATLRGAYGLQWIGTRPVPQPPGSPLLLETFTGIAIRSFDGEGNFSQTSTVKGSVVGLQGEDIESSGTYQVNEDCSGTAASQFVPGGPTVTATFVIVDNGDEVLQSVMTPVPLFNAGVMKKIRTR